MQPKRYRKKPVEIEAVHLTDANVMRRAAKWCGGRYCAEVKTIDTANVTYWVDIPTLEGVMSASFGDYIIKGIQGEFYPCKPDIFEATYDTV